MQTTIIELDNVKTSISREIVKDGVCKLTRWYVDGKRVGNDEARKVAAELLSSGGVVVEGC